MYKAIDFVIPWVDGNDKDWQKEKAKYEGTNSGDNRDIRYRDYENLHFWFRGVEKYAPWVNKIHLITWGHLPAWLNVKHPKLNIVRHKDYIPKEYLPTFNSHVIEIHLHRIEGLSEQFVYFNDDIFITRPLVREDFFENGYPKDIAALDVSIRADEIHGSAVANCTYAINRYFDKNKTIKENFSKWFNPSYGKYLIKTLMLSSWKNFTGFQTTHLATSYLKSTFEKVWEREETNLKATSQHKFRDKRDLMQFIFKFWQLAEGNFMPGKLLGKNYNLGKELDSALHAIKNQHHKLICLNDNDGIKDFEAVKERVNKSFQKVFPKKSEFEIQ